jgi:enamine deaminase RidA (YjgF/YER057c/UK114 family)
LDATSEDSRTVLHLPIEKRAVSNPAMLNEAYAEAIPKSYSRGMRIDLNGLTVLLISGTFSSDEHGNTVCVGDFRGQLRRTLDNITGLLAVEGCTWHDVVRTTCYLRDMDRDYDAFNEVRTAFFSEINLDPLPASTGVEAKLCRTDLLVDIDAIAMFQTKGSTGDGNA